MALFTEIYPSTEILSESGLRFVVPLNFRMKRISTFIQYSFKFIQEQCLILQI